MSALPNQRLPPRSFFVAVAAAVVVADWPWVSSSRIRGVQDGMTEAEVVGVMGRPCGIMAPYHFRPIYYLAWSGKIAKVILGGEKTDGNRPSLRLSADQVLPLPILCFETI